MHGHHVKGFKGQQGLGTVLKWQQCLPKESGWRTSQPEKLHAVLSVRLLCDHIIHVEMTTPGWRYCSTLAYLFENTIANECRR